jgi:two-component system, sensor histidine kinase and response regulator
LRLLIVDDRQENLVALEVLLRRPGREIVCVRSGSEAIEEFKRSPPTLVLLDVLMPGMSGIETAEVLRSLSPRLPIVFVTAAAHDSHVQREARRVGALGCLFIASDAAVLIATIADVEAISSGSN